MARIRESIPLIENASAGRTCIVRPSIGRTWLDCHIEHGGLTLAQMTNIKVILVSPTKTITIAEYKSGTELNEINKRYGRKTEAGTLSFYFRRPEMGSEPERMATALGTMGLQMVKIEFDIAPATTPDIQAWGKKTANRHVGAGLITYVVSSNKGGAAQGDNYFDAIDRRDRIAALHILNDKVESVDYRVDDSTAFNLDRARADFDQEGADVPRVPYATDYGFCIDFLLSGVLDESLVMSETGYQVQQMRLNAILGANPSTQIRLLTEYLSTWASLNGEVQATA